MAPDAVCVNNKCLSKKEVFSQQIIDKCKEEEEFIEQVRSDPNCLKGEEFRCVDGWGGKNYYNKRLVSANAIESATKFPPDALPSSIPTEMREELEKATIAVHSQSTCSCTAPISYQILGEDKLDEVTCEKFYKTIEDYNSSCDDCLLIWSFGCC